MKTQELPGSDVAREPFQLRPGNLQHLAEEAGRDPVALLNLALATDPYLLLPLVEDYLAHLNRAEVRASEQRAFSQREGEPTRLAVAELVDKYFATGDGWVRWGEATVEDHQARIAFLKKMRTGIDATIERHEEAIKKIIEAGVTCLDEL